ncbi:MAG: hypothetical protein WCO21_03295 [bacterium]
MPTNSLGIVIILISLSGYVSNWLNWRYLNYRLMHLLYYVGAFVHESSHAILCLFMGAKIEEYKVLSSQPHVLHRKSKIPLIGEALISFAPILGGLLFLYLVNHYALGDYFVASKISDWGSIFTKPFAFLSQLNLLQWQSWIMILLFFNVGAMLGPSTKDLKNVWFPIILLFFVQSTFFTNIGLMALSLILTNILIQLFIILILKIINFLRS